MIGFGISTCNRKEYLMECLDAVWKFMPADGALVIGDDGSTDGTAEMLRSFLDGVKWGNGKVLISSNLGDRKSIARNKRTITDSILRAWPDVEDIILIEDDVVPQNENWWRTFRDTAAANTEPHLLYMPTLLKYGPVRKTTGPDPLQIQWKRNCSGMVMYFRAALLREVGSFEPGFGLYGWDHNELSNRCLAAAWHAPEVYPHCLAAERDGVLKSKDVDFERRGEQATSSCGTLAERTHLAKQNQPLYAKKLSEARRAYAPFQGKSESEQVAHRMQYFL